MTWKPLKSLTPPIFSTISATSRNNPPQTPIIPIIVLQPQFTAAAQFAPLGLNVMRAVDVLGALPDYLPSERMGAAFLVSEFASDRFGIDAPFSLYARELLASVVESRGEAYDGALASLLADSWRPSANESGTVPETTQSIVRGPLFQAGAVRFYQAPFTNDPIRPHEIPSRGTSAGGYLVSNESNFSSYFPAVSGLGGVVLGIGSFQNLDLALAAEASGLIFCDLSPLVAMTLTLLLPQLPSSENRFEFGRRVLSLIRRDDEAEPFLDPIPDAFRPAFAAHVDQIRISPTAARPLQRAIKGLWNEPESFLGDDGRFRRAAELVAAGGVSVAYGNFFGPGMPPLLDAALSVYDDPVRVVHLTNAPEQMVQRRYAVGQEALEGVLQHARVDPDGRLLLSTEFTSSRTVRRAKRAVGDTFSYHAVPLGAAARLLRAYGRLAPLVRRFEDEIGLQAD